MITKHNGTLFYCCLPNNSLSGDLPAREFEAGNSVGGTYPCMCGVEINEIYKETQFLTTGPFKSLSSRAELAKSSPALKEKGMIDVNSMKVRSWTLSNISLQ